METPADIRFVHLGLGIEHLRKNISVFGFPIAFYGIIIGVGMLFGLLLAQSDARRRGQDPDVYFDFALYAIIFSIVGARIYYVVFNWNLYKDNVIQVLNLRAGGLAIYGGVIAAVLTLLVFTKVKNLSFVSMADTGCLGLVLGQSIGRWGNFFNCEAFGGYTDSLFAMRIKRSLVDESMISQELLDNLIVESGVEFIQVHPTFLYESIWNLGLLLFMLWYRHHKQFDGEMLLIYLLGYGLGRSWIEGLRTDQLLFFGTGVPVSQALSMILVFTSASILLYKHMKLKNIHKGEVV